MQVYLIVIDVTFRFAEQDLYVLLATLLRRYRLEYPVGEGMDQVYNTLLFPDRPVRVKFINSKAEQQ